MYKHINVCNGKGDIKNYFWCQVEIHFSRGSIELSLIKILCFLRNNFSYTLYVAWTLLRAKGIEFGNVCCLITDAVGDRIYIVILSLFFDLSPEALDYPDWLKRFYLEGSLILHQCDIRKMVKIQRSKNKPLAERLLTEY